MDYGFSQKVPSRKWCSQLLFKIRGVYLSQCHGSKQAGREALITCRWEVADSMLCTGGGSPVVQEKICCAPWYL